MQIFLYLGIGLLVGFFIFILMWKRMHSGSKIDENKNSPAFFALMIVPTLSVASLFAYVFTRS